MYSFGIILQEIYTREDPFAELADTLTPRQVVQAVCSNHLRPQPNDDIPMRVRQIMEIAWADNPASRPSFDQVRLPRLLYGYLVICMDSSSFVDLIRQWYLRCPLTRYGYLVICGYLLYGSGN